VPGNFIKIRFIGDMYNIQTFFTTQLQIFLYDDDDDDDDNNDDDDDNDNDDGDDKFSITDTLILVNQNNFCVN
jgi:hypothetical protein